jgi:proliferating cell nuclear antigen PCNA
MDKAHVCLYDIKVDATWFSQYEFISGATESGATESGATESGATESGATESGALKDVSTISINPATLYNVLSITQDHQTMTIHYSGDPEKLNIDFVNELQIKGEFSKYFEIPLIEVDMQMLDIPEVDYDAEFSVSSKKMHEITTQLSLFGETMNIFCSEEALNISATGDSGKMMINIPIDDLNSFSINEGQEFVLNYSLNYVHKMCVTNKLAHEITFGVSETFPMKISYDIGDASSVSFYLAPKIE